MQLAIRRMARILEGQQGNLASSLRQAPRNMWAADQAGQAFPALEAHQHARQRFPEKNSKFFGLHSTHCAYSRNFNCISTLGIFYISKMVIDMAS